MLNSIGETKNTQAVTASEEKSIPDFQNSKVVDEIKMQRRLHANSESKKRLFNNRVRKSNRKSGRKRYALLGDDAGNRTFDATASTASGHGFSLIP